MIVATWQQLKNLCAKRPDFWAIAAMMTWVDQHDQVTLGEFPIKGKDIFVIVKKVLFRSPAEADFEAHQHLSDFHHPLSGPEDYWVAPADRLPIKKKYSAKQDVTLYRKNGITPEKLTLTPGMCAVFYPNDAHLPELRPAHCEPLEVIKIIGKIRTDLLPKEDTLS